MVQVFFYSSKYEKKNAIQNASIVEIFGLELLENTVYETQVQNGNYGAINNIHVQTFCNVCY